MKLAIAARLRHIEAGRDKQSAGIKKLLAASARLSLPDIGR